MFYSIIMTNSAVTRAGAPCWCHRSLKTTEVKGHIKRIDNLWRKVVLKDETIPDLASEQAESQATPSADLSRAGTDQFTALQLSLQPFVSLWIFGVNWP